MGRPATVEGFTALVGGNSREIYRFVLDGRPLVMRRDPDNVTARFTPGARIAEFEAMRAALGRGVPVPEPLWVTEDRAVLGSPFIIMAYVEGEAIPRRILRDEAFAEVRPRLADQCGRILARLHSAPPPDALHRPAPGAPAFDEDELRGALLDSLAPVAGRYPALEFAQRWLLDHAPQPVEPTLVHGDFRNGNLLIGPDGIRGVLDWEAVHVGDPLQDLGWLCVRSWRFGNDHLHAGGFGTREELVAAYESESGNQVDLERLRWWEIMGTARWGIGCVINVEYFLSGVARNIEMAALGRRVAEMEYDLLELIAGRDM
jgi:aminoglycoside phosphotransferase (APT) family kinase protein